MFAPGRRWTCGLAAAAGGLLAAACAVASPLQPDRLVADALVLAASGGARVQPSRLVSRRELPFRMVQKLEATGRTTVLVHEPAVGERMPVAILAASKTRGKSTVAIHRLRIPPSPQASDVELATLEHLYSLALAEEAEAAFCLAAIGHSCDASRQGRSQAAVLDEIRKAREGLASPLADRAVPWRAVSLAAARGKKDEEEVRVVVRDARGPLAGGSVAFHKAPHFGCRATSGSDGVASCRLADLHPEEHTHDEHDDAPVVATYSGDVRKEHVLLPTTLVMKPHASHKAAGNRRK
jgi:hypothetical protein